MATGKPCKNTLYFGFSYSYPKNELGDPNLLHKSQQDKMKLSEKLKKISVKRILSYLKFSAI